MSPLPCRFRRLGSRLCAIRSIVSLCRQRWRSLSFLNRTAGFARHFSSSEISRLIRALDERPARQRSKSAIATLASLLLSSAISAHAEHPARGWFAVGLRASPNGMSSNGSSMPSNLRISAPAAFTTFRDWRGRLHATRHAAFRDAASKLMISAG